MMNALEQKYYQHDFPRLVKAMSGINDELKKINDSKENECKTKEVDFYVLNMILDADHGIEHHTSVHKNYEEAKAESLKVMKNWDYNPEKDDNDCYVTTQCSHYKLNIDTFIFTEI